MEQTAVVISSQGGKALVRVMRMPACSGCHRSADGACHECRLSDAGSELSVTVTDPLGCRPGERVRIASSSSRTLLYAALVYGVPLLAGLLGLFVPLLLGASPVLGMVLFFLLPLLVFVILKNTVEKSVAAAPLPCITARLDADFWKE